jgi:hypothetical protein
VTKRWLDPVAATADVVTLDIVEALHAGRTVLVDGDRLRYPLCVADRALFALACRDGFLVRHRISRTTYFLERLWRHRSEAMDRATVIVLVRGQTARLHVDPITRRTEHVLSPAECGALDRLVRAVRSHKFWVPRAGYFVSPPLAVADALDVAGAAVHLLTATRSAP